MPAAIEETGERAALGHVHHERVAVDVVADVAVVEPGHRAALELGAFPLAVPVDRQQVAIGVERREKNEHHAAEHAERLRVVARRQRMQQLVGRLGRADLRCVNARTNGDDDRVASRNRPRVGLGDAARIGEPQVRRANLLQSCDVLGRGNDRRDQPVAVGRWSRVDQLHAIGFSGNRLEVLLNLGPAGQLPILAHPKPKEFLWGLEDEEKEDGGPKHPAMVLPSAVEGRGFSLAFPWPLLALAGPY